MRCRLVYGWDTMVCICSRNSCGSWRVTFVLREALESWIGQHEVRATYRGGLWGGCKYTASVQ